MNKRKTTILSVITIISFLTPVIYADSLIHEEKTDRAIVTLVDEGFESGIPVDWMNTAWVLNWYGFPHNGSNFVSCNAEGGLLKTDDLSFEENTELSFWYAVDNTVESLDLEVKIDDTQLWYQTVIDTIYQKATIDLSSYSGDHQISFICQTSAFTTVLNIDDIFITTEDNSPPVISDISIVISDPIDTNPSFGWENISCTVTDNVEVNTVWLNITFPDYHSENVTMAEGSSSQYYYNESLSDAGGYSYYIWVNDTNDNSNISTVDTFEIPPNWDINIDHQCSIVDLVLVAGHFDETGPLGWIREDLNNDGQVSIVDLVLVSGHFDEIW